MQKFLKTNRVRLTLLLIIFVAAAFRLYGINWDLGHHLHPDERAIVMFTTPLQFPDTIYEFFSTESTWNPHFFAYGSFPLYLLKIVGNVASAIYPPYATYEGINIIGRFLSTLFDIGTLIFLFLLSKKLFNIKIGLLAAFFYGVSVLPIQLSHFYAVDTALTLLVLLTLYMLIVFYEKPTLRKAILVGIFFGLSLATKTSALVLLVSISIAIIADFLLLFFKNTQRILVWLPHVPQLLQKLFSDGIVIIAVGVIIFAIAEPYAFIDFPTFWRQNMEQAAMTRDAYTFPYTLQYVGKIPYFYELKNIFLWGQGPILATFSFLGTIYFTFLALKKEKKEKWAQEIILATFFWAYFFVVGRFAIGFMRYLLPIYPLLCLFAAVFFFRLLKLFSPRLLLVISYLLLVIIWPLSFFHIYTKPNTRILASQWIYKNITANKTLAVEHWDDQLPIGGTINYTIFTLPLYEADTSTKWEQINNTLDKTDYIIIASNRLYVPLQKLTDCSMYRSCYPKTAQYYEQLFNGSLGFQKAAEFSSYPTIPLFDIPIDDQSADESFTVYDHPKVIIFKRYGKLQ